MVTHGGEVRGETLPGSEEHEAVHTLTITRGRVSCHCIVLNLIKLFSPCPLVGFVNQIKNVRPKVLLFPPTPIARHRHMIPRSWLSTRSRKGWEYMASKQVIRPNLPKSVSNVTTSKFGSLNIFVSDMKRFFLS